MEIIEYYSYIKRLENGGEWQSPSITMHNNGFIVVDMIELPLRKGIKAKDLVRELINKLGIGTGIVCYRNFYASRDCGTRYIEVYWKDIMRDKTCGNCDNWHWINLNFGVCFVSGPDEERKCCDRYDCNHNPSKWKERLENG